MNITYLKQMLQTQAGAKVATTWSYMPCQMTFYLLNGLYDAAVTETQKYALRVFAIPTILPSPTLPSAIPERLKIRTLPAHCTRRTLGAASQPNISYYNFQIHCIRLPHTYKIQRLVVVRRARSSQ